MKWTSTSMGCALALLATSPLLLSGCGGADAQTVSFTLSSPDIAANGTIGNKFVLNGLGCSGQNVSPALTWANPPAGTQSFSVTLYDPDAPTGSGFWHLSVHDIPSTATGLAQGAANSQATLPTGAYTAISDYHDTGLTGENDKWGGPCPPAGDAPHRYVFTVYALDVPNLPAAAQIPPTGTAALHGFALNKGLGAHVLAKSSFTATYGH